MLSIAHSNEASPMLSIIVNCFIPNMAAGVRLWPFTDTTGGATITYSCSDGYWPQTNQTSQCSQVGSSGYWIPYPAPICSSMLIIIASTINYYILVMCSAPDSLLAVPVQANDSHPYVEGDMVNFQCLAGLSPTDVVIATCTTMEGIWRPDPQLLNCFSTTQDTTSTTTISSNQGM